MSSSRSKSKLRRKRKKSKVLPSYQFLLLVPFVTACSYILGLNVGRKINGSCEHPYGQIHDYRNKKQKDLHIGDGEDEIDLIDSLVSERLKAALKRKGLSIETVSKANFPNTVSEYANAMVKVSQREFKEKYIDGTPMDYLSIPGNSESIILYNTPDSIPNNFKETSDIQSFTTEEALQNCDTMNVIYQNPRVNSGQCLALIGDLESHHIQKWMKIDKSGISNIRELQPVGQNMNFNGHENFILPGSQSLERHRRMLKIFLETEEEMKKDLMKKLECIAVNNTVIVMTTNFGQADLLMNFICAAKARDFDVSNVIVFATDEEAMNVARGLDLEFFYNEENYGSLSSEESKEYGDKAFSDMMYSKVLSVLLVNSLGYDVLYQDVDIVWYKHPLALFHSDESIRASKDIIFQDDGSRSARFSSSFANSGFYFARYNERTQYLFTRLLYSSGMIFESRSHQQVLIALMNEHISSYGLRVEILQGEYLLGGKQFHRDKTLMKNVMKGLKTPFIFHMSWTKNKENKIKFLKQMGLWHVRKSCHDSDKVNLKMLSEDERQSQLKRLCCSIDPLITCSFSDKPSIIPCNQSPNIDKNGHPFW